MRHPTHHTTPTRGRTAAAVAGVALLALIPAACGGGSGGSDATPTTTAAERATTTAAEGDARPDPTEATDPGSPASDGGCPDTDDVAEVLGGPVEDTASGGGKAGLSLGWSYQGCGYDLVDGDGSAGIVRITVDRTTVADDDAATADFALLEAAARAEFADDGFEPLDDLGDDAYRDGTTVAVRQGAQMYFVSIDDPADDGAGATLDDVRAAAGEILDVDLSLDGDRLCESLDAAIGTALGDTVGTKPRNGVVGIEELSFETGGCSTSLGDGRDVDVDVADAEDWDAWVEAKRASTFVESYEATEVDGRAAFHAEDGLFVDDGEQPLLVTSEDLGLDADAEAELRVALAELALGA